MERCHALAGVYCATAVCHGAGAAGRLSWSSASEAHDALVNVPAVGAQCQGMGHVRVVLVELDLNAALGVCERMRSRVAGSPIATSAGPLQVSVSIGVHSAPAVELPPLPTVVERADRALYAAKRAGRNRIESA